MHIKPGLDAVDLIRAMENLPQPLRIPNDNFNYFVHGKPTIQTRRDEAKNHPVLS